MFPTAPQTRSPATRCGQISTLKSSILPRFQFLLLHQFYCLRMARCTEGDVQNALADLENRVALATAATRHGIPRNTLCDRFNSA
ncbi:hypothetical protein K469DRAFT_313086 [Zopfia rhizophila CBS 207.26]|uniref:Uncharacterized protein n=1 Tax=Zopfia rhizophila CBS 207.26 TaxID=1314779 RepID=A0A6A6ENH9_9PEZI|nr:hypothetical protein K469DRAFT_313086 [Zopfia rhizophila CBS 207.26]